jgi:16S rRNA G966 N2-methylase RsmD
MRIIAGEFRGRKLLGPESEVTRPITDRVKQSLFDILIPNIPGARVYDCFAGTGSMGLECLSRGAEHVIFFEADRSAAARLRRNIETVGVKDRSTVVAGDLFKWFDLTPCPGTPGEGRGDGDFECRMIVDEQNHPHPTEPELKADRERGADKNRIDLIFLDPPYRFLQEKPELLLRLAGQFRDHLAPTGVVIFRHDAEDDLPLPPLHVADTRNYGSMTLQFLILPTTNNPQPTTDQ